MARRPIPQKTPPTGAGRSGEPRKNPSSTPSDPGRAGGRPPPSRRASPFVPTIGDVTRAREEALLQLRLGRQALYLGLLVGAVLFVDSYLSLLLETTGLLNEGQVLLRQSLPLLVPVFAAAFLSVALFFEKLEPYGFWPFEPHFAVTVASVPLSLALASLYLLHLLHFGPDLIQASLPWTYPLAMAAISLPLVGLGLTWRGSAPRKIASLVLAALPVALFFPIDLALGRISFDLVLAVSFSGEAFLTIAAGAILHLMATATRAQEREVVAGGHEKLFQISADLSNRAEALNFREESLLRRESDVASQESDLQERSRLLEERRRELDTLEAHLRGRGTELLTRERELIPRQAAVEAQAESLTLEKSRLVDRLKDLEGSLRQLAEREKTLLTREQAVRQSEVENQARSAEIARLREQLKAADAEARRRLEEAETRLGQAMQKEAEVRAQLSVSEVPVAMRANLLVREQSLGSREANLELAEKRLAEDRTALGEKTQALENARAALRKETATLSERQAALSTREASLAAKEREVEVQTNLLKAATQRHEDEIRKYYDLTRTLRTTEGEAALRVSELKAREETLSQRESRIAAREGEVRSLWESLRRREAELESRRALLEGREAALRLREARESPGGASTSRIPSSPAASSGTATTVPSSPGSSRGGPPSPSRPLGSPLLPAPPAPSRDRVPTGTQRLDELLQGGLPPRSHLALVGPAFTGKEILLYGFVAEGLRKGQPALVIAASRAPREVAQEMGVILPSLVEYEQAGLLRWIDASTRDLTALPAETRSLRGITVEGPGDYTGILQGVSRLIRELEPRGTPVRVAYLSLSASLTQKEDRPAFAFLQNLVGILKVKDVVGAYSVDQGVHGEQQLEAIQTRMDGSLLFKAEGGKNFLSVVGLGDIPTRTWVEYRFTQRGLTLGSFSLERIR